MSIVASPGEAQKKSTAEALGAQERCRSITVCCMVSLGFPSPVYNGEWTCGLRRQYDDQGLRSLTSGDQVMPSWKSQRSATVIDEDEERYNIMGRRK